MRKALSILGLAGFIAAGLHAGDGAKSATSGVSPDEAWRMLAAGNERFARGLEVRPHVDADARRELAHAQRPWAVVVSGSDSRVCPEIVFDQGLGDLYVVRNGASVVKSEVELGSIEYAVRNLGAKLVVVMGNSKNDLVNQAVAGGANAKDDGTSIAKLEADIQPAVDEGADRVARISDTDTLRAETTEKNVLFEIKQMLKLSPYLAAKVESGEVKVIGGVYHLENNRVVWLGEHPSEKEILAGKKP